ncbi:hypothetical protein LF1_34190 [Rubripirellula obstinata]|uniref:DUF1294 domain-containing protein n=1 Tax=Rubripirellula obstinata TaxID=406547 RepID=A0A5B1CI43_9BACT|nr:DUF1294 domain-containing protein [Rubripirellula obstinata]KAA1260877.1 hypothetical protein LF1_34190 [Rubripirellula obstinata]
MHIIAVLGLIIAVASIVTAILYRIDKRRARDHEPRIPEQTLLMWSLAGGWPGGWVAGKCLHHKTRKTSYRVKFALCVALNVGICIAFVWLGASSLPTQ